jgi:hypothetical protein
MRYSGRLGLALVETGLERAPDALGEDGRRLWRCGLRGVEDTHIVAAADPSVAAQIALLL